MLENLKRDTSSALRALRSHPGSTAVVVLSLAVGVGVTTVAFSLVNAMALRGLPDVGDQERLLTLGLSVTDARGRMLPPSVMASSDIEVIEARSSIFSGVAGAGFAEVAADVGAGPFVARSEAVTPTYFTVLEAHPFLGTTLAPHTGPEGGSMGVVVSYRFWRRHLGADPRAVGRSLHINGGDFEVLGVMPRGFTGMTAGDVVDPDGSGPDLWLSVAASGAVRLGPTSRTGAQEPTSRWLRVVARLAPGVTREEADAALPALSRDLRTAHPEARREARLVSGDLIFGPGAGRHRALFTVVGFLIVPMLVLLVACANAASLLLARTAARRRELAIRASLGATRGALLRQLLIESSMLGLMAGVLALAVAIWSRNLAALFAVHLSMDAPLDLKVFVFALGVSLASGLGFGLMPALSASRQEPGASLSDSGRGGHSRRLARVRHALVVGQVTLALMLLVICGLFVRSVQRGLTVDTGMDEQHLLVFTVDLGLLDYPQAEGRAFYRRLEDGARSMAGVASVALAARPPLAGLGSVEATASSEKEGHGLSTSVAYVGRTWFETTGIPLVAGTSFPPSAEEGAPAERVAVVSRALAERLWPGESPLGRVLVTGRGEDRRSLEVVGVAGDVRTRLEQPATPILFLPMSSAYSPRASLLVRTDGPGGPLVPAVRRLIGTLDARLPVQSVETVEQARRKALAPWRLVAGGMGFLGILALLLASAGLYGVVAFAVTQRTREIGVRMALGADRARVLGMVFRWTLLLLGTGAVLGMLLAALVASLIRKALFGVSPLDPLTYLGVGALLVLVGVIAALRPAIRAASVEPSRTLVA